MNYDAFISYRHSDGRAIGRWLRSRLISYRLPNALREGRSENLSVYLDEIYDKPNEDFWGNTIEPALIASRYLIVVATPDSAKEREDGKASWMEREIETFLGTNGSKQLIVVLADGEINQSVPKLILDDTPNINVIDVRSANNLLQRILNSNELTDKIRTISSVLFNVPEKLMPVLREEDRKRRQRTVQGISVIAIIVTAVIGYLILLNKYQVNQRELAETQAEKALTEKILANTQRKAAEALALERKQVANASRTLVRAEHVLESDPASAIALALASTESRLLPSIRPIIEKAAKQLPVVQIIRAEERIIDRYEVMLSNFYGLSNLFFSANGENIIAHHVAGFSYKETVDEEGNFAGMDHQIGTPGLVTVWNVETGKKISTIGDDMHSIKQIISLEDDASTFIILFSNGEMAWYRIDFNGVAKLRAISTDFTDLSLEKEKRVIIGCTDEGDLSAVDWTGREIFKKSTRDTILSVAVDSEKGSIIFIDSDLNLHLLDLLTGETKWSVPANIEYNPNDFSMSWKPAHVDVQFIDHFPVFIVSGHYGSKISLKVFVIENGSSLFEVSRKSAACDLDARGGKFAFLTGDAIEQWEIQEESTGLLSVNNTSNWKPSSESIDIGEGQELVYGPFGEYLVSANAPTMTLVGATPGTVSLWFANPYTDSRAGDVHRGKLIGSRDVATFNIAFNKQGSRLALFSRDGLIRIYDVFQEKAVSTQSKASDFFSGYRHLSMEARALLDKDLFDLEDFVFAAKKTYKVRLSNEDLERLRHNLDRGLSIDNIPKLEVPLSTSLALQNWNQRDERPNLAWGTPVRDLESYTPLTVNPVFLALVDDVINGQVDSDNQIIQRYHHAVQEDVLLLTGLQIDPLMKQLNNPSAHRRSQAWIGLALSGDKSLISELQDTLKLEADEAVRGHGRWAIDFLQSHGEDMSLRNSQKFQKSWANRKMIVSFPDRLKERVRLNTLVGLPWDGDVWNILINAVNSERKGKTFALLAQSSRIIKRTSIGRDTQEKTDLNYAAYLKENDLLEEALSIYGMLLKEGGNIALLGQPENGYGFTLFRMGRYEESLDYFELAIKAGRPDGWPERNIATALIKLGRDKEANIYFEQSINRIETTLKDIAETLKGEKKERVLSDGKREAAGFYNAYAWHLITTDEASEELLTKGLTLSKKAAELSDFQDNSILDTLAHAHAVHGNFKQAILIERKALEMVPETDQERRQEMASVIQKWEKASMPAQ